MGSISPQLRTPLSRSDTGSRISLRLIVRRFGWSGPGVFGRGIVDSCCFFEPLRGKIVHYERHRMTGSVSQKRIGRSKAHSYWKAALFLMAFLVASCGGTDANDLAIPGMDLFEQPVADAPDPAERAGAAAQYIECVFGISNGGWSQDFGPPASASDPDGALERFLDMDLFALPHEGYAPAGRDTDRLLYTYTVDESAKVAIIVAMADTGDSTGGWTVETYATCDPAEYHPSTDDQLHIDVWLDSEGKRVPTSTVTSYQGAEHCGWESVTFLVFEGRQYIGDPRGLLADFVWFDDSAILPVDAIDTGYHQEERHLWISGDEAVAYLVVGDQVEAWPAPDSTDPIACA